jgi:hypothetical protein
MNCKEVNMKKQIELKRSFAISLFIFVFLVGLIFPTQTIAQNTQKPPKIEWYVEYVVTIRGDGKKEPEPGDEDRTITWSIDRTYSANLEFVATANKDRMITKYKLYSKNPAQKNMTPFHITITDKLEDIYKGTYHYNSFQTDTVLTNWDANETDFTEDIAQIVINNKTASYNVFLPMRSILSNKKGLKKISQTTYDRSKYGFGGKPMHEELPVEVIDLELNSIRIPSVGKILPLAMGAIVHPEDLPLPLNSATGWDYDSGVLQPDKPLIQGIPDSKTNVEIRVHYKISRTPLY